MTTPILIPYAADDPVSAHLIEKGVIVDVDLGRRTERGRHATLASYAGNFPMRPGDIVIVDNDQVVEVKALRPSWMFEVFLRIPEDDDDATWSAARWVADDVIRDLAAAQWVHRGTIHTVTLAVEDLPWFDGWLASTQHVKFVDIMRRRDSKITLEEMQRTLYSEREKYWEAP